MSLRHPLLAILAFTLPLAACGDDTAGTPSTQDASETSSGTDEGSDDTSEGEDSAPQSACNVITQTGCEADQNCTYVAEETTPQCVPQGTQAYGAECGGDAGNCERGVCLNLNDTRYLCYKYCKTEGHCDDGASCLTLTGASFKVCEIEDIYTPCNLIAQDCEGNKGCYVVSGQPTPVCLPAGTTQVGGSCTNSANDCAPGTLCISGKCYGICDPDAAVPCPDFVGCSRYAGAGYCDLP